MKPKKYWLRGLIIGLILWIVVDSIIITFGLMYSRCFTDSPALICSNPHPEYLIVHAATFLVPSLLLGLLYGKIKKS